VKGRVRCRRPLAEWLLRKEPGKRLGFIGVEALCLELKPSSEQQDDQHDDNDPGGTAKVVIAGAETVAAASDEEKDQEDEQDIHWG